MNELNLESLKQFLFTVSNPTHELVSPEQYANLVSSTSQYQLIPGVSSDVIEDPWEVVLSLLPRSKTTLIDVTLSFIWKSTMSQKQSKILARYLIYKQQLIGIKTSTSSIEKLSSLEITQFSNRFKSIEIQVPSKIINFYETNQIHNYQKNIKTGNFYLITNNFKISMLFLSQIKDQNTLLPYVKVGCQVISIVNDEEFNYDFFVSNFQNPLMRETIQASRFYKLNRIRQICNKYKIFLVYGGCRVCPSINELYFSKSFLVNYAEEKPPIQTDDFDFIPVVNQNEIEESVFQLQHNPNLTNSCEVFELNQNILRRQQIITKDHLFKSQIPSIQKQVQLLDTLVMDENKFQIAPLSLAMREQIYQYIQLVEQRTSERQNLFKEVSISGKSMIRCMWVFNMINLFILSKQRQQRSPFTIGIPFTRKTKNLFDTIVFVFDRIKSFEERFVGLKIPYQLSDFVQLYRYQESHNYLIEQQLIRKISGDEMQKIPLIEELIKQNYPQRKIYLCSDDEQQKNKLRLICESKEVELTCLDFILIDDFNLSLDFKTQHKDYEVLLQLEQHRNILELFTVKLRNLSNKNDEILSNGNTYKQYPQEFIKLKRQLLKKKFLSIRDAVKFIILEKKVLYEQKNKDFFLELIAKLSQKYKSNINSLSQINKFFVLNSPHQINDKIIAICEEIMRDREKENALLDEIQSYPEIISLISEEQCNQTSFPKEGQLYCKRLQKCKKLKMMKEKKITLECHRCGTHVNKKWLQKCHSCYQLICLACIEQIRGVSGSKMAGQLSRYCPVCHKTCGCEKCRKKNEKLSIRLSQQLRKQRFEDDQSKPNNYTDNNNIDKKLSIELFQGFTNEQLEIKNEIISCKKCQLQGKGGKRSMWVECKNCGQQECYFCVETIYKDSKYKLLTLSMFYKNWMCFNCDTQWQRHQQNSINLNSTNTQIINDPNCLIDQFNHPINHLNDQIIQKNKKNEYDVQNLLKENKNVTKESKLVINDQKQKHNTSKYQYASFTQELPIKGLDKYILSNNKPTVHLPTIDPHSNTPIFPLPQKPLTQTQSNASNQQNKIPTLLQPLPPKPLVSTFSLQTKAIAKNQAQNKIQLRQRNKQRRDSSQSNNDNGIANIFQQVKIDARKRRSRYQIGKGGPMWKKSNKLRQSSSSSSLISHNSDDLAQFSESITPNFAQIQKKSRERDKNKSISKIVKQRKRRKRNRRRDSSFSSPSPSDSSQRSSGTNSRRSSSSNQRTNLTKKQEFTISIEPRVDSKRNRTKNRQRSRSRDEDINIRKYYLNKRSNSKDSGDEDSTRRTTKKYYQNFNNSQSNKVNANLNKINNLHRESKNPPQQTIIYQKDIQEKRRSQSSSKRQSIFSKKQQQNKIEFQITHFDVVFPQENKNQLTKQQDHKKLEETQTIKSRQQFKIIESKEDKNIQSKDPRRRFAENNFKTKFNKQFQAAVPVQPNAMLPPFNVPSSSLNSCPSPSVISSSSASQVFIPGPTASSQSIYKNTLSNNVNLCPKGVQQSRQSNKNIYNPGYKPPIRTLVSQSNTNNSYYANYHKQVQEKQSILQSNKNLLFKKENKNDEDDEEIQY